MEIPPPEFNIGDVVECEFEGTIEGVTVRVRPRFFVMLIKAESRRLLPGNELGFFRYWYGLAPTFNEEQVRHIKQANELIRVEPVVQAIAQATT